MAREEVKPVTDTARLPAEVSTHVEVACAKLNLGLKVLNRRPDGYHDIVSVLQTVSLVDILHFCLGSEERLTCTDPALSCGPDNLVQRTTVAFNRATRDQSPGAAVRLHLDKRIPVGAGLGGGSADAAASLRGLNRLSTAPLSSADLLELGAGLGSDVPFALTGGTALVGGRGERLEPLVWEGPTYSYVLVYPGFEVSTAWAYGQHRGGLTDPSAYLKFISSVRDGRVDGEGLISVLENDFEPLIQRAKPIVAEVSSHLNLAGALVCSMSGTGSTVYGIFDDRGAAQRACEGFRTGGFRSFFCEPVGA